MTPTDPWTCPTCNSAVSTPYCPACGERPLRARELTLRGLFDQLVQAFTNIDGRLIRSLRYLVGRPGFLTVAYLRGQRKLYVGPVPIFLIANTLFFATESLTSGTVITTPLESHLHTQPWSPVAESMVTHRLEVMQTTLDVYAPDFDRAMARNARSLIILMALSFVVAPSIVFYRSRRPIVLLLCVATVVPPVDVWFGGGGYTSDLLDSVISIALLVACAMYLYVATGKVYGANGVGRVLKAVALTAVVASIVLAYRFVLFLVTLYST